jgi:predicted secreted protein
MKKTIFGMLCALLLISCNKEDYDFTVSRGEVFTIELRSAPGAGMSWEWKNKTDVTCVDTVGLEEFPLIEERRTGEVIEKWNFKGVKKGNCTLLFEYINARDKSVIERKEFLIRVKE